MLNIYKFNNFKNKKSISPLIATILLIVVAVAVIGVIVLWGKGFTHTNLSLAQEVNSKSELTGFVFQENLTGTILILKNAHTRKDVIITGYKINSFQDYSYLNTVHTLDTTITLNHNTLAQIDLGCVPESKFSVDLITSENEYINIPVTATYCNASLCTFSFSLDSPLTGSIHAVDSNIDFNSTITNATSTPTCLWSSNIDGNLSTACNFTSSTLTENTHVITLEVTDSGDVQDTNVSILVKTGLVATINTPSNNSGSLTGNDVSFTSTIDNNYGVYSCSWDSNRDGSLGTDCDFNISSLSIGTHLITLSVTDDLETSLATTTITISPELLAANILSPSTGQVFYYWTPVTVDANIFGGSGNYTCTWKDNNIIVANSCSSFDLNYSSGTWVHKSNLLEPLASLDCSSVGTKIYCLTGFGDNIDYNNTNYLRIYDTVNDTWSIGSNSLLARSNTSCASEGTKIYCAGGSPSPGVTSNIFEVYDTVNNSWSTPTNFPVEAYAMGSFAYNNKIYYVGGTTGSYLNTLYIYDVANNSWSNGTNLPLAVAYMSCGVINNKAYCVGGFRSNVFIYDIINNSWENRLSGGLTGAVVSCASNNLDLYCVGNNDLTSTYIYSGLFTYTSTTSNLLSSKAYSNCAFVDDTFYCAGGFDSDVLDTMDSLFVGDNTKGTHLITLDVNDGSTSISIDTNIFIR